MLPHLQLLLAVSTWVRLRRLGGVGLVILGVADNSVIPLTGSMDVLTIWLAARHHEPWPYYALMATVGAVLGGYITYSLARKDEPQRSIRDSKNGASAGSRFRPFSLHHFLSCLFSSPPALCSILEKNFWGLWCSAAQFVIQSPPTSGSSTETISFVSFLDITN